MANPLERLDRSADITAICAALRRSGAVVVENILTAAQLAALNADLDRIVAATLPGLRHPTMDAMVEFYGQRTIRFDGLPAKSPTFLEAMLLPQLTGAADRFLLPNCLDYLFNTGQLIEIHPGESAQRLHRDEDAWNFVPAPRPQLEVEAMFALTDFTPENGATHVVPGSHAWPLDRRPQDHDIVQAAMPAGSALIYLGSTIHGGGANVTQDTKRRGMFLGYVVGWLRTEENSFLTVPIEAVRGMPKRIQELLGYKAHRAIGVVDVGSPMALLGHGAGE